MSEITTAEPTKIEFIQYHQPGLKDADYEITVNQTIKSEGKIPESTFTTEKTSTNSNEVKPLRFSVAGERFELKPTDIHTIFPPAGSLGEHSNVLPHIILNRSTLPWERLPETQAVTTNNNIPWLALLLFEEGEKPYPKIITLKELKDTNKYPAKFPKIPLESGQQEEDKLTIIDVKKELLEKILPAKEDLEYLAHVRQGTDNKGNLMGNELAIIISNRLPKKGSISTVHLISVEGRYKNYKHSDNSSSFDFQNAENDDYIRLVSLKSWSFACVDEKQSFKRLLTHLNRGQFLFSTNDLGLISKISDLKSNNADKVINKLQTLFTDQTISLSHPKLKVDEEKILWRILNEDNQQYSIEKVGDRLDIYRRRLSTLRLPKVDNKQAERYLSMGYIPLPHFLRQGGKTFSWYHSPLIPGNSPTDDITLPVRAADELVRYNPNNGMFDISYAAAWELGRLQALESSNFSISLYNWKRSHRQSIKRIEKAIDSHLPFHNPLNIELPKEILSWFENLSLLKGIPFNYLVPDEQMLPIESIRFFCVDSQWIECLLDGAFSIGRVTTSDYDQDLNNKEKLAANPHKQVSGFLLRSDVVAGWPTLQVDGYDTIVDDDDNKLPLPLLRQDRLSANVLICLFKGEIKTVDIHQKPESLHFGLDSDDNNTSFYKKLKNKEGNQVDNIRVNSGSIPWKDKTIRSIDISQFKEVIKTELEKRQIKFTSFTSAQFALEMIEGVEKVRFTAN